MIEIPLHNIGPRCLPEVHCNRVTSPFKISTFQSRLQQNSSSYPFLIQLIRHHRAKVIINDLHRSTIPFPRLELPPDSCQKPRRGRSSLALIDDMIWYSANVRTDLPVVALWNFRGLQCITFHLKPPLISRVVEILQTHQMCACVRDSVGVAGKNRYFHLTIIVIAVVAI